VNLRKKCAKVTGLILAIAVGLLLTGALFHKTFCSEELALATPQVEEEAQEEQEPEVRTSPERKEKKKTRRRRARKENIKSQQSKIKKRLIRLERTLDRKIDNIRRLKHHDRSASVPTGTDTTESN